MAIFASEPDVRDIKKGNFFGFVQPRDKIIFLLRYAVLAPSTHNSQPWLFQIEKDSCKIYYDPRYAIHEADPLGRDLYISFGCLIENLVVATKYYKVFRDAQYILDERENLIAQVFFDNLDHDQAADDVDASVEPMLEEIVRRVNVRGMFEPKPIDQEMLSRISALNMSTDVQLHLVSEREKIRQLAALTAQGLKEAYKNKEFRREMSQWMTSSITRRKEGLPGYSLRMPDLVSLFFPYIVRFFNLGAIVAKLNYKSVSSAPAIAVISAVENSKQNWLEAGRLAQMIMLEARVLGLKTSIFVAAIEIGELYKQVQEVLGTSQIPQLLMCVGYMDFAQKPNMRHPVEEKLM